MRRKTTEFNVTKMKVLLGPAPLLSSENPKHYEQPFDHVVDELQPRDIIELMLIRRYVDCTWHIKRYTRHQTLLIERQSQETQRLHAEQAKQREDDKDQRTRRLAEQQCEPIDIARIVDLETVCDATPNDIRGILGRVAEIDHNRTLQNSIVVIEQLAALLKQASVQADGVLDLLDHYRAGLGDRLRKVSNEIIDADCHEVKTELEQLLAPPLAPSEEVAALPAEDLIVRDPSRKI